MYARLVGVFFFLLPALLHASEIRGKVVSVIGGEPLARVQVTVLETGAPTVTAGNGTFSIQNLAPGNYTLRLNAVGYRLVTVPFSLTVGEQSKEFEVTLVPDNFRRTETVEVKGDVFNGSESPAINQINLTSSEVRETSTVLANDPLRSVQSMPGVSASGNNDFDARISVSGAPFEDVSIYLDGILVPAPFHGAGDFGAGATLSILTSDAIEGLKLFPAAYPEKYGDAVGAALALDTRDGSRAPATFRASVGLADTDILGEGQLGRGRRGSWLASARKSYLGYLLRNRLHNTFTDVSFYDADLKLTYDLRPNQTVSFYGVGGHTLADLVHPNAPLKPNGFKRGTNEFVMARMGWRWTINPRLLLDTRAAFLESPFTVRNVFLQNLQDEHYNEAVIGSTVVWSWHQNHILEGGWTARRVFRSLRATFYDDNDVAFQTRTGAATGWHNDAYLQQASSFFGNRLRISGGVRLDSANLIDVHPVAPQLSASFRVATSTEVQFGAGRYTQFEFPVFPLFFDFSGFQFCSPGQEFLKTANHYTAGVEHRIGEKTRLRATFFDRQNRRYLASVNCPTVVANTHFQSVGEDYSRGVQFVLQSRTANRLSGWIGYTLTYANQNGWFYFQPQEHEVERVLSPYYPTLQDQRHTLNAFASYRLSPTVHLSAKWLFGSGFPEPSGGVFPDKDGHPQFVGLNSVRMGTYQRLDLRAEKDWAFKRWKLALYGEMLNLTNHDNQRFVSLGSPDPVTGWTGFSIQQGLPITPTAAIAFEF